VTPRPAFPGEDIGARPALRELARQLRQRHHDAVEAVLLYGSCLRSGDIHDGLLDVYLLCGSYRAAYGAVLPAVANRLLPPNVFYYTMDFEDRTLRCKVAVISQGDFRRGCERWFQSYIWGRFAQPVAVIYARDVVAENAVHRATQRAAATLLARSLPALPPEGDVLSLWEQALSLSYATELRTERPGRSRELVAAAADYYRVLTRAVAPDLDPPLSLYEAGGELCYRCDAGRATRRAAAVRWWLRRLQGKALSVLRLLKALFTFEGGLDYIAWKLQRHSGQRVDIPPRVRRYPLIFIWGFFWRLYRRGVFR